MIKEKVKSLWRVCFDDSEEFMEMYFRLRYNNEVNIAIESGQEIIAALQMLPYPMTFCGKVLQTSYISGACTHPDYRGNGVMRELLSQAFTRMLHSGTAITTLIPGEPWLFDYYKQMGYVPVFSYSKRTLLPPKELSSLMVTVKSTTDYEEEIYQYLHRKLMAHPCCVQHTESDFNVILEDLATSNNALYVATHNEKVVGIAVAYQEERSVRLAEYSVANKEIGAHLLAHIQQATGCDSFTLIDRPVDNLETYPLGMARIIDVKAVLQLYATAYPEDEMSIELVDKQLSTNSGCYYLYGGKCMYGKERLPGAHIQLTIGELSEKILTPLRPYMSLMLN